jgi:hypothetical protein
VVVVPAPPPVVVVAPPVVHYPPPVVVYPPSYGVYPTPPYYVAWPRPLHKGYGQHSRYWKRGKHGTHDDDDD